MSEATFRMIVAISVLAAILAFVVQAALVIALYSVTRKMKRDTARSFARLGSILTKVEPMFHQAELVIEKTELVIDSLNGVGIRVRFAMLRVRPIVAQTTVASSQVEGLMHRINQAADATHQIFQVLRPGIADTATEVRAIMRSVRAQVEDVGVLFHDVGHRVRRRLDQIDHTVDCTVRGFERISDAVLRPVRVVNGIAAALSAAVVAFVRSEVRDKCRRAPARAGNLAIGLLVKKHVQDH